MSRATRNDRWPPNKGLQPTVRGVSLRSTPHPAAEAPAVMRA